VPLAAPLTSTSWDGDPKTSANRGIIDLSAVFGAPAGVKAVSVWMLTTCDAATKQVHLCTTSDLATIQVTTRHHVVTLGYPNNGVVNCDANGDIYFYCDAANFTVELRVLGYWI